MEQTANKSATLWKKIRRKIRDRVEQLLGRGSKNVRVGTIMFSPYLKDVRGLSGWIQVTRYISDDIWYFKQYNRDIRSSMGGEMRAGTPYSNIRDINKELGKHEENKPR